MAPSPRPRSPKSAVTLRQHPQGRAEGGGTTTVGNGSSFPDACVFPGRLLSAPLPT